MSVQTDYYVPQMRIKDETISACATEITRLRAALVALYEWYDQDGSVGGASEVFEANRSALSNGERK